MHLPEDDPDRDVGGALDAVQVERPVDEHEAMPEQPPVGVAKVAVAADRDRRSRQAARDRRGPDVVDRPDAAVEELVLPDDVHVRLAGPDRRDVGVAGRRARSIQSALHRADALEQRAARRERRASLDRPLLDREVDEDEQRQRERVPRRHGEEERGGAERARASRRAATWCERDHVLLEVPPREQRRACRPSPRRR